MYMFPAANQIMHTIMRWDYTRRNRFNGETVELTKEEAEIHDQVFYHEALEQWDKMLKAKDKFSRLNPKAYMVLLD